MSRDPLFRHDSRASWRSREKWEEQYRAVRKRQRQPLENQLRLAIAEDMRARGYRWIDIALQLGVSKQRVHQICVGVR